MGITQRTFQSPVHRGGDRDFQVGDIVKLASGGFNPLFIGAVIATRRSCHCPFRNWSRFNPLFIGAVIATEDVYDAVSKGKVSGFNPLFIGAVIATDNLPYRSATEVLSFNPLFIGAVIATMKIPISVRRFSPECFNPLFIGAVIATCRTQRHLGSGEGKFQSPVHRGGDRDTAIMSLPIPKLVTFQSPVHRGGDRDGGRVRRGLEGEGLRFQSPVHRGGDRDPEMAGPGGQRQVEFQSPVHRGGDRDAQTTSTRARSATKRFNPLFIGAVIATAILKSGCERKGCGQDSRNRQSRSSPGPDRLAHSSSLSAKDSTNSCSCINIVTSRNLEGNTGSRIRIKQ